MAMQDLRSWEVMLKRKLHEGEIPLGVIVAPDQDQPLTRLQGSFTVLGLQQPEAKEALIRNVLDILKHRFAKNEPVIAMVLWRTKDEYTICWSPGIEELIPVPETLWPTIQRILSQGVRDIRRIFYHQGWEGGELPLPPDGWIGDPQKARSRGLWEPLIISNEDPENEMFIVAPGEEGLCIVRYFNEEGKIVGALGRNPRLEEKDGNLMLGLDKLHERQRPFTYRREIPFSSIVEALTK